jgi:hypothetical protein
VILICVENRADPETLRAKRNRPGNWPGLSMIDVARAGVGKRWLLSRLKQARIRGLVQGGAQKIYYFLDFLEIEAKKFSRGLIIAGILGCAPNEHHACHLRAAGLHCSPGRPGA